MSNDDNDDADNDDGVPLLYDYTHETSNTYIWFHVYVIMTTPHFLRDINSQDVSERLSQTPREEC